MDLVNKNKKPHWFVGFMSRLVIFIAMVCGENFCRAQPPNKGDIVD